MAFNNFVDPVMIAPNGGTAHFFYTFFDNRGAQYAMANCRTPGAIIVTTSQSVRLENDGHATYFVDFRNDGTVPCSIGHGHRSEETAKKSGDRQPHGGLRAGPGQKLHELDLPEDVSRIDNWDELH